MDNTATRGKNCLGYGRVSTAKQAQQGESVTEQSFACKRVAEMRELNFLDYMGEQFTGRKESRPGFDRVIKYITNPKNPKVHFLIVKNIDRLTRNGVAGYEQIKNQLLKHGVEIMDERGVIQASQNTLAHLNVEYSWSRVRPSESSEFFAAQKGKEEVTDILTRMIGTEISLVREGYKVRQANDGYINQRIYIDGGKKRMIEIPDPIRSQFYIKMFELRASGAYSDEEIVERINAMGYRSRTQKCWAKDKQSILGSRGGIPLTVKQLQSVIQRPIYCGVNNELWIKRAGDPIKTKYAGLITIETFNKANRGKVYIEESKDGSVKILKDYNLNQLKRMKDNPLFPFKRIVLCPLCKMPFLGSSPTGKSGKSFPTYHCKRNHKQYGVSKAEFEKQITAYVKRLTYRDPRFLKAFEATLKNKFREHEKELGIFAVQTGATVIELENRKQKAIDAYSATDNPIIRESLENKINDLHVQLQQARKQRDAIEVEENDIHSFVGYVKDLMEHPEEYLVKQEDNLLLRSFYGLVFEELPTYEEILNGTPKLSLPYKLSDEFIDEKSLLVTLPGVAPGFQD